MIKYNVAEVITMKVRADNSINISKKSFIIAILIIFALMVATYVLTFIVPGGEYARKPDEAGNLIIDTETGFTYTEGGISFFKWLLSPILVLTSSGNGALIAVIVFLLVIGGVFNSLNQSGLMVYMLDKIVYKFGGVKYKLMAVLVFFFMSMGSLVGSFEEVVPMVPLIVSLSIGLGWDAETGVAISLLATGSGFAAGVANPFTIGVAQGLAGLPMFSGIWLRLLSFALIYGLLMTFILTYAKKVEKTHTTLKNHGNLSDATVKSKVNYVKNNAMEKGLVAFAVILGIGILLILSSGFIPAIRDFTMIIVAVMFLMAGTLSVLITGMKASQLALTFRQGVVSILPSVIMILMAASIKYTMIEAKILDTMLNAAVQMASGMSSVVLILFIYLICLVMNFFIPSGSAKAFLLIPLIVPLAKIFNISSQLCIIAFAFGDGFSNVFYPTNPVLLISLGLAGISYGKWAKFSAKFQLMNLVLTSGILLLGLAVNYS